MFSTSFVPNDSVSDTPSPGPPQQQEGQRPMRQKTQQDQDQDDDKARQKTMENLIQSWMDRLQLISVITTFFAANEAQLLSITTPSDKTQADSVNQAANAMLNGALVLHSFSAVISFLGAFVLVRYKLKEAKKKEDKEEGKSPGEKESDTQSRLWSSNPHIEQVGYFRNKRPPVHLLYQAHSIAVITAFTGFVFGMVGIICYSWSQQPQAVSIFTSAVIGLCFIITIFILGPFAKAEQET